MSLFNGSKAAMFRRDNPTLYEKIMEMYHPVFDRITAIELYQKEIPPPTCEICGVRIQVSKKMGTRCRTHAKHNKDRYYSFDRLENEKTNLSKNRMAVVIEWSGQKYVNEEITILCSKHGVYSQLMSSFLNDHSCQQCYFDVKKGQNLIETADYLLKFKDTHGERYSYDASSYVNASTKMRIICDVHGEFFQSPITHRRGHGCPKCADNDASDRMASEEVKSKMRSDTVEWIKRNPNRRQKNTKIEIQCMSWLSANNIRFEHQYVVEEVRTGKWIYDFFLPDLKLLVELDGEYWHRKPETYNRDLIKHSIARDRGLALVRISDTDLNFGNILLSSDLIEQSNHSIMESRYQHIGEKYGSNVRRYSDIQSRRVDGDASE
jgi:very-short-patch-repair endonuclease